MIPWGLPRGHSCFHTLGCFAVHYRTRLQHLSAQGTSYVSRTLLCLHRNDTVVAAGHCKESSMLLFKSRQSMAWCNLGCLWWRPQVLVLKNSFRQLFKTFLSLYCKKEMLLLLLWNRQFLQKRRKLGLLSCFLSLAKTKHYLFILKYLTCSQEGKTALKSLEGKGKEHRFQLYCF